MFEKEASNGIEWSAIATFLSAIVLAITLCFESRQRRLENNIKSFLEALNKYNEFVAKQEEYWEHGIHPKSKKWVKGNLALRAILENEEFAGNDYYIIRFNRPLIITLFNKLYTCFYFLDQLNRETKDKYIMLLKDSVDYEQQLLLYLEYHYIKNNNLDNSKYNRKDFEFINKINYYNFTRDLDQNDKNYLSNILNKDFYKRTNKQKRIDLKNLERKMFVQKENLVSFNYNIWNNLNSNLKLQFNFLFKNKS